MKTELLKKPAVRILGALGIVMISLALLKVIADSQSRIDF